VSSTSPSYGVGPLARPFLDAPLLPQARQRGDLVGSAVVRVTVVVPTYNEAGNIARLCREVRAAAPDADLLIVDDASPDGTADLVEDLGRSLGQITVIRRSGKLGLGAAYRAGLRAAIDGGAEICVQMDADLSHDPAVLPALIANAEYGADLAIGSRYVPGGLTENWPRRRRMLSRWGNRYAAGVLGLAVNDATAGYRAYRTDALERMEFDTVTAEGYGFQVEMTYRLVRIGGKVVEFPITFRDRTAGESKMSGGIVREALVIVIKLWVADFEGRRRRRAIGG
jgi:dolichol-phosphate mannosyltransferase